MVDRFVKLVLMIVMLYDMDVLSVGVLGVGVVVVVYSEFGYGELGYLGVVFVVFMFDLGCWCCLMLVGDVGIFVCGDELVV